MSRSRWTELTLWVNGWMWVECWLGKPSGETCLSNNWHVQTIFLGLTRRWKPFSLVNQMKFIVLIPVLLLLVYSSLFCILRRRSLLYRQFQHVAICCLQIVICWNDILRTGSLGFAVEASQLLARHHETVCRRNWRSPRWQMDSSPTAKKT